MAAYVEGEAPETDSEDEQYLFNLSYMKIGSENPFESPNVAISNTKDMLLKGNIVDGMTNDEDLLNTPVATEITEDFAIYPLGDPATPAEFFYENELLRRKINEISTSVLSDFIQSTIAPISKQLIETDTSLINTQLTLQNVSTSMKSASDRTKNIHSKFEQLIESNFLPKFKQVPDSKPS